MTSHPYFLAAPVSGVPCKEYGGSYAVDRLASAPLAFSGGRRYNDRMDNGIIFPLDKEEFTTAEAAMFLGITHKAFQGRVERHHIPRRKVGHFCIYSRANLMAEEKNHKNRMKRLAQRRIRSRASKQEKAVAQSSSSVRPKIDHANADLALLINKVVDCQQAIINVQEGMVRLLEKSQLALSR